MRDELEIVRDQYAAVNERDWERARAPYTEDVRMVITTQGIRAGTYEGVEAVSDWFGEWFSSFDGSLRFEITELTKLDDGRVLVLADHSARGRTSGVAVTDRVVWAYRFEEGKIVELWMFESREDAVAASS